MNEPRNHLPRDLKALRYLDALNAGDLDAVAALWEEATHDPELEQAMAELDHALFVEDADASGKAGADRLRRSLPLLSPGCGPQPQSPVTRRRAVWLGAASALAAACLLVVLTWQGRGGKNANPNPPIEPSAHLPDNTGRIAALLKSRRELDEAEPATFTWPLPETSPSNVSSRTSSDLTD